VAKEKPHYFGHRQRLRDRFLKTGADGLADYELLELILFGAKPRSDVKPLAKLLIKHFGSFADVVTADVERLREVDGMGEASIVAIKTTQAAALRMMQEQFIDRPALSSWNAVLDYMQARLGRSTVEELHAIYLDRKNTVLADEALQRGTVDHTPVYPREIVKRALDLGATALILVHNHPSGDPTPSRSDIEMTKKVKKAVAAVDISLHDHIIIGRGKHASLKSMGLL
jgi:DNA repair protein RadC